MKDGRSLGDSFVQPGRMRRQLMHARKKCTEGCCRMRFLTPKQIVPTNLDSPLPELSFRCRHKKHVPNRGHAYHVRGAPVAMPRQIKSVRLAPVKVAITGGSEESSPGCGEPCNDLSVSHV